MGGRRSATSADVVWFRPRPQLTHWSPLASTSLPSWPQRSLSYLCLNQSKLRQCWGSFSLGCCWDSLGRLVQITPSHCCCSQYVLCNLSVTFKYWLCSLFRNIEDIQKLSELGVLFLLFEMGLELSLDRLKVSAPMQCQQQISGSCVYAGPFSIAS